MPGVKRDTLTASRVVPGWMVPRLSERVNPSRLRLASEPSETASIVRFDPQRGGTLPERLTSDGLGMTSGRVRARSARSGALVARGFNRTTAARFCYGRGGIACNGRDGSARQVHALVRWQPENGQTPG